MRLTRIIVILYLSANTSSSLVAIIVILYLFSADLMEVLCINDPIELNEENKLAIISAAWTEDELSSMVEHPLQLSTCRPICRIYPPHQQTFLGQRVR